MDFKAGLKAYYDKEKQVIDALDYEAIDACMNLFLDAYKKHATIYVFGNGGSAATASHMVCDFNKGTCCNLDHKFRMVCLNDNVPIMMAIANDDSYDNVFAYQLKDKLTEDDVVLAISGSGNSHNIVKAVEYAKEIGARIVAMTGYEGGKIAKMADYHLHAPVDDMQITEDIHMTFCHAITQLLWKYLYEQDGKEAIYRINQ